MKRPEFIMPIVLSGLLAAVPVTGQSADIAEWVLPLSQEVKRDCDRINASFDGGCGQYLGAHDPRMNWYSRDHQHCLSGPAMDFIGMCDGPCKEAFRGCYRVRGTNFTWDIFKMTIYPAIAARFLAAPDPMAVPPDRGASSQYVDEWHCDQSEPLEPHNGTYAKQFVWGEMSSNQSLLGLASLDFTQDPAYWAAYHSVADGYQAVRGWDSNRNPPGSLASDTEAWKKRWAIFHNLATGPVDAPYSVPVQPWWAATQVCEDMILLYIHPDDLRRTELGFWEAGDPAFNAAVDQIYFLTDGRVSAAYDPRFIFWDVDVAVEGPPESPPPEGLERVSWGEFKQRMMEELQQRGVRHD